MAYEIVYSAECLNPRDNVALEDHLDCIDAQLTLLASDPVNRSQKSNSASLPTAQMFQFGCETQESKFVFTAYFHYVAGKDQIRIVDIVAVRKR